MSGTRPAIRPAPEGGGPASAWARRAALAVGLLGAYLLLVLLHGTRVAGVAIGTRQLLLAAAVGTAAVWSVLAALARRGRIATAGLQALTLGSGVALACLLAADVAYTRYLDRIVPGAAHPYFFQDAFRLTDPQIWLGELMPREFHPTRANFALHKPGVSLSADVYGWFYYPAMLRSPTLADSVLERRHVATVIDAHGFRETTPLAQARIFALGDSFTFGTGTTQDRTWVEDLERRLGEPVYNLGHNASSPRQELLLLEYLFETQPEAFRPRTLLWMIFEGNDLDDSYADDRTPSVEPLDSSLLHTAPRMLGDLARAIAQESVLRRIVSGEIRFGLPFGHAASAAGPDGRNPYEVDGVRLTEALYRSRRFGDRLFLPAYVERAAQSPAAVHDHPNWPRFEQTLDAMADLARRRGFRVVVLLAPAAPRLYARSFEDFPAISAEPAFLDAAGRAASERGFAVIDLARELAPRAARELLYWRDDTHWNERGHAAVAEIVARHLRARPGPAR